MGQLTTQQSKQHRSQSHLSPNFSGDIPTLFVVFYLPEARPSVTVILSLTLAHPRGEGIIQGHRYPGVGTFGIILLLIIGAAHLRLQGVRGPGPRHRAGEALRVKLGLLNPPLIGPQVRRHYRCLGDAWRMESLQRFWWAGNERRKWNVAVALMVQGKPTEDHCCHPL